MNHKALLSSVFAVLSFAAAAAEKQVVAEAVDARAEAVAPGRLETPLNRGWRFRWGKASGAECIDFDDAAWKTVDLPHDAQFEQPWTQKGSSGARGFKPMGECWYRNAFATDPAWAGHRVLLDFGGILCVADVYVNGQRVGRSDYGYLGFEADVTKFLKPAGETNVVAVWAGSGKLGGSRWYTGVGLYRTAKIVAKPQVAVARHGLFVRTPEVTDARATVAVTVELDGFRGKGNKSKLVVKTTLADADGKVVAANETRAPWAKLRHQEVVVPTLAIANPKRWDVDSPNLYTATVALELEGVEIDRVSTRFGVRTFSFDPAYGFKLNGRKLFLKGMANHHDAGLVGAAAFPSAIRRQFETMKAFGYNLVRCSHNPYDAAFYDLADELGLLVVDELIDKWSDNAYWFGRRPFTAMWPELVTEWVKRDRNHPSVFAWSLGNEFQMNEDLCGYGAFGDWGVTMYRVMRPVVQRWDPTRPTTAAMFPARKGAAGRRDPGGTGPDAEAPELSLVTDFASFNYRWMDYASYVKHAPGLNVFQSEATVRELLAPFLGMDREHMIGLAYWGAIEYWGESNGWPKKGWNYAFFSHTLQPYPSAYLIKSAFVDEPVVRIAVEAGKAQAEMWNDVQVGVRNEVSAWEGTPGKKANVRVYTNAESVELFLNGASLGEKRNDATDFKSVNTVGFEVPFAAGTLCAVAKKGGREVARHEVKTAGAAVALKVEVEHAEGVRANGLDLVYVRVAAVDANGTVVPSATNRVSFAAEGALAFYACDNGDHYTDELFTSDIAAKNMKNGFILAAFRAGVEPGEATITVASEGLPPVEKKVSVVN